MKVVTIETIKLGELCISVTRKNIKTLRLAVHPPQGRVMLSAPKRAGLAAVRAFVLSKQSWIRQQQLKLQAQVHEAPSAFLQGESHWVWGQPCVLSVYTQEAKPSVQFDLASEPACITLTVRPGSDAAKRAAAIHEWHKSLLHAVVPGLIDKWEPRLGVKAKQYFLQHMKTRWGSCHHTAARIRLNTELVKKTPDLLEYVIVHELAHLLVPNHGPRFVAIMDKHLPAWREARVRLNARALVGGAENE